MEDDHTEESSDGTLARGDDHSNYTHKQEYVEVIDAVDELKEPDKLPKIVAYLSCSAGRTHFARTKIL